MNSLFFCETILINDVKNKIDASLNNNGFRSAYSLVNGLDKKFTGNLSSLIGEVIENCNDLIDWIDFSSNLLKKTIINTEKDSEEIIVSDINIRTKKVS